MEADRMIWGGVFTYCDVYTLTESCTSVCRSWRTGVHRRLREGVHVVTNTLDDFYSFIRYERETLPTRHGNNIRVAGLSTTLTVLSI